MIEDVDGATAPESLLRALHLVEVEADLRAPGEPPRPVEDAIVSYRNPGTAKRRRWLARVGGEPAGAALLSDYGGSLVVGNVLVRPSFRRRGVGTELFEALAAGARVGRIASFFGEYGTEAGAAFARASGAVDDQRHLVSVLDLTAAAFEPPVPPAGIELRSWTGPVPEELVDSFVRARNAMADAPVPGGQSMPEWTLEEQRRDEERCAARREPQHVTVAVSEGEVLSLTGVRVSAGPAPFVRTDDTATVPDARGQGLALAVKTENLRRLRAERPDVAKVATKNAEHNAAMRAVNAKLGFEPVLILTTAVVDLNHG
ncbi:MAG TPA: GNAT family N-acetyltransferase [Candidatus Binatia bacterium]